MVQIAPSTATLGATVTGFRLNDLRDREWRAIEDAFHEHAVLVFPRANLTEAEHIAFSRRFGPLFVSDVWNRRLPTREGDKGRFFLEVHYARRDIAQRVKRTATVNHIDLDALGRIRSKRERRLLGLHPPGFHDG